MKTYYVCDIDSYGQRTGTYTTLNLSDNDISINQFGCETYNGRFLYDSLMQVLYACQD
jgi:hypothetical protein